MISASMSAEVYTLTYWKVVYIYHIHHRFSTKERR